MAPNFAKFNILLAPMVGWRNYPGHPENIRTIYEQRRQDKEMGEDGSVGSPDKLSPKFFRAERLLCRSTEAETIAVAETELSCETVETSS